MPEYYRRNGFPDVVVMLKVLPYDLGLPASFQSGTSTLQAIGASRYLVRIARPQYTVYRRDTARCGP
jgi:hypothetical protein